jgi:hypothetical protein
VKREARIFGRRWAAAFVVAALCGMPLQASANEYASDVGIGIGSGLASLIYAPAKLIYAGGGTIVAGLAWVASGGDREVSGPIINAALLGDYVVTPAHLRRQESLVFVGKSPEHMQIEQELGHASGGYKPESFESETF